MPDANQHGCLSLLVVVMLAMLCLPGGCDSGDCPINVRNGGSIQRAISRAEDGDLICVASGTYLEKISFEGKAVHVLGVDGPARTTIDGDGDGPVVTFERSEGLDSILEGFTVTGGIADAGGGVYIYHSSPTLRSMIVTGNQAIGSGGGGIRINSYSAPELFYVDISHNTAIDDGGGIFVDGASSPILDNFLITDNAAEGCGGGVYIRSASPMMKHVSIANNSANNGGGMYFSADGSILENISITGNTAWRGGGIYFNAEGSMTLTNVTIHRNSSSLWGGGIYIYNYTPILFNVDISANSASEGGGICRDLVGPEMEYCNAWNNSPENYDGMTDPTGTNGNISVDPEYLDATGTDPLNWDLHLDPVSLLVDAGSPDIADPDGGPSDIGSFGGPGAEGWDLDFDGYPGWWLPGIYDPLTSPGMDCDDKDSSVYPEQGC